MPAVCFGGCLNQLVLGAVVFKLEIGVVEYGEHVAFFDDVGVVNRYAAHRACGLGGNLYQMAGNIGIVGFFFMLPYQKINQRGTQGQYDKKQRNQCEITLATGQLPPFV